MKAIEAAGYGDQARPLRLNTCQMVWSLNSGCLCALAYATQRSRSQSFSSSKLFTRTLGVKKRSRTRATWFSTCPFSQPEAGVQAVGSTR